MNMGSYSYISTATLNSIHWKSEHNNNRKPPIINSCDLVNYTNLTFSNSFM